MAKAGTISIDASLISVTLTKDNGSPTQAVISYRVTGTAPGFPSVSREVTFTPDNVPGAIQTQLENLVALALAAAKQREGIP